MSNFLFFFQQIVPPRPFAEKMGLTLFSCFRKKSQIRAWEMLPAMAQQLLVVTVSYLFFEADNIGVNRLVRLRLRLFCASHVFWGLLLLLIRSLEWMQVIIIPVIS